MAQHELILTQSNNSPYAALLGEALRLSYAASVARVGAVHELARLGQEAPALIIWDISGWDAPSLESVAQLLAVSQAGVMLICPGLDQATRDLLGRINPVALLVDPQSLHQVAAALEVALATHRRILDLGRELEQLREQLQDRVLVERAKRVLMEAQQLSEAQAMTALQSYARRGNQKLAAVARKILAAYRVFNGLHEGEAEPGGEE